jgi:hypothetical protein
MTSCVRRETSWDVRVYRSETLADVIAGGEQTASGGDQMLSDGDQTSSDSDQTSADSDQVAADRGAASIMLAVAGTHHR